MTQATAMTGAGAASIGAAALTAAGLTATARTPASKVARAAAAKRATAPRAAAPRTAAGRSAAARPAAATRTSTTSKTGATAKTSAAAATTTGYATVKLPKEFSFLTDPKISIEEKLSRFIGLMMTRSEQRLLEQMEKMAAGSTGSASGTASTGSSSAASSKSGFSLWSFAKSLLPPLGMAASVVGDSTLKSLINQLSGPVLSAAATAIGLPELAPAALKLGPKLAKLVTGDAGTALASLTGSAASAAATSTGSSSSSTGTTTAKVTATEGSTSEKAQLLELQRLQDQDRELYSLFSNMLKSMHDARMTAVQNIR